SPESTAEQALDSLGWLVGEWVEQSERPLACRIEVVSGGKFLRRTFTEERDGESEEVGYEMIGYDPTLNLVRSWTFFADGSFGSATWHGGDDHWRVKASQTLADGSRAIGTYVVTPVDEDTLAVKLISREVDGQAMPSGKVVSFIRVHDDAPPQAEAVPTTEATE
ncbi:MAG: hypothetical protein KDA61_12940, partial [Planctomycetales bacterium]|nr:hypothetical protein [Planctomycetales bacterium]